MGFLSNNILHPQVISLFSIAKIWPMSPSIKGKRKHLVFLLQDFFSVLQLTFNDLLLQVRCGPYTQFTIKGTEVNSLHKTICSKPSIFLPSSCTPASSGPSNADCVNCHCQFDLGSRPCTSKWEGFLFVGHNVGKATTLGSWYGKCHLLNTHSYEAVLQLPVCLLGFMSIWI